MAHGRSPQMSRAALIFSHATTSMPLSTWFGFGFGFGLELGLGLGSGLGPGLGRGWGWG